MKKQKNRNFIQYEKRIIDAFIALSKKNKDGNISVTDIVTQAGMTRPTFYLHFKTIDDIYKKLEQEISSKIDTYLEFYSDTAGDRADNLLRTSIELSNIIKHNEDMFRCFINSSRFERFISDITNKVTDKIAKEWNTKKYYDKVGNDIGWWDWLISYTIIDTQFHAFAKMIKGAYEVDYDFLAYWCANMAYKLISDTWKRLGIKIEPRDFFKEYLDKKNKK